MKNSKKEISKMLSSYEPLIRKLAAKYYASSCSDALELEDFLQEGRIGFITAAQKFDFKKGRAFSSYVENGIRMALRKLLSTESRLIRFPKYRIEQLSALERAEKKTLSSDDATLAKEMGMSEDKISMLKKLRLSSSCLSLDDERGGSSMLDKLCVDDFSSKVVDEMMLNKLSAKVDMLGEREGYILKSISGSFGCERKSKLALSKEMDMSYASINSLYKKSMTSLRKAL